MAVDRIMSLIWVLDPGGRSFKGQVDLERMVVLTGPSSSGKSLLLEAIAAALDDQGRLRARGRRVPSGTIVVHPASPTALLDDTSSSEGPRGGFRWLGEGDAGWMPIGADQVTEGGPRQVERRQLRLPRALHAAAERIDLDALVSREIASLAEYLGFAMDGHDLPEEVDWLLGLVESRTQELVPPHVRTLGTPVIRTDSGPWHDPGPWARVYLHRLDHGGGRTVPAEDHGAGVRRWLQLCVALALHEIGELFHGPLAPQLRRSPETPAAEWHMSRWRYDGPDGGFWVGWAEDDDRHPIEELVAFEQIPDLLGGLEPWRRPLLLLDEPELHLHPLAQRQVAEWCRIRAAELAGVVVATHSPAMMALPADVARHYYLDDAGTAQEIGPDVLGYLDRLGEEAGFGREAWIVSVAAVLLVEGQHDLDVVQHFFGEELRSHRIKAIPLHGGRSWKSIAESEFFSMAGIPLYFMFDNVRYAAVADAELPDELRVEERWAWQLARLSDAGRRIELVPYEDPDIMCGLRPDVFVRAFPHLKRPLAAATDDLTTWQPLVEKYRRDRIASSFKSWVLEELGLTSLSSAKAVTRVIGELRPTDTPTPALSRALKHLLASTAGP